MRIQITSNELELLQLRLVDNLSKLVRPEQRIYELAAGSRTREYKPLEQALMQAPIWIREPDKGTCRSCGNKVAIPYIGVPAFAPGSSHQYVIAKFCDEACLISFCYENSELDRQERLAKLEKEEEAEIAPIRQKYAKLRPEAERPRIVFCYVCRNAIPVTGNKPLRDLRRCAECERQNRDATTSRFCNTCGKPFRTEPKRQHLPINCSQHSAYAQYKRRCYKTRCGMDAFASKTKDGYRGRISELGGTFRWDTTGRVVNDDKRYDLVLDS